MKKEAQKASVVTWRTQVSTYSMGVVIFLYMLNLIEDWMDTYQTIPCAPNPIGLRSVYRSGILNSESPNNIE